MNERMLQRNFVHPFFSSFVGFGLESFRLVFLFNFKFIKYLEFIDKLKVRK